MKMCRVLNVLGAAIGYAGAMIVGFSDVMPDYEVIPTMLLLLTVALFCGGALVVTHHQRPMRMVFELGYEARRRDEIREATERARVVTPIRRHIGLEAFTHDKVGV